MNKNRKSIISQKEVMNKIFSMNIEKIFLSPNYKTGLDAILKSIVGNGYGLKLTCNNGVAQTDGKIVKINLLNPISASFEKIKYKSISYKGLLAHEIGHILFTDFELSKSVMEKFKKGEVWNPNDLISHPNLPLMENKLKDKATRLFVFKVLHSISNLLEDIFIESKLVVLFPGALKTGIILNNDRLGATFPSLNEQLEKSKLPFVVMNALIASMKAQVQTFPKEIKSYVDRLLPICNNYCFKEDPEERMRGSLLVLLELWSELEKVLDELKQNKNNSKEKGNGEGEESQEGEGIPNSFDSDEFGSSESSNESSSESSNEGSSEGSNEGSKESKEQSEGNGNNSGDSEISEERLKEISEKLDEMLNEQLNKYSDEPLNQAKKSKVTQKKKEQLSGNKSVDSDTLKKETNSLNDIIDDSISKAEGQTGKGKVTFDNNYNPNSAVNSEQENLKSIAKSLAVKEITEEREQELSEALKNIGKNTQLKGIHRGVDICVHRSVNTPSDMEYKAYLNTFDIISTVKRGAKSLEKVLREEINSEDRRKLYAGNRYCSKDAYRPDKRVFLKTQQPSEQKDVCVTLLIDESGSMSGSRIESARKAAIFLYEYCKYSKVSINILGHTTGHKGIDLFSYADADSVDGRDGNRLLTMTARYCNRDGAAIRFACERLLNRPEEKKLFLIISDGQPNGGGYSGQAAYEDLKDIKKEYERKGIEFIAAAIGDDKERIKAIYGSRSYLDIDNLDKLPKKLANIIARKVLE